MAAVPQKVLNWLYSVLTSEYTDVNRTYSDVAQTLSQNSTFSPRTDVYTYENGRSSLYVHLTGTLPVPFRGTTYMFPLSIWVPHGYPREVPLAFVTPTKEMAVRPGQHVSGEGRIYHPYLAGWRPERSSILEFLHILQDVFAREPPVISKQEQTVRPLPPSQTNGAPPVPPLPPELGRFNSRGQRPEPQISSRGGPPPPPPKPFEGRRPFLPHQQDGPPPVPPHPSIMDGHYPPATNQYSNGYAQSPQSNRTVVQFAPQRSHSLRNGNDQTVPSTGNRPESTIREQRETSHGPVSPMSPIQPSYSTNPQYNPTYTVYAEQNPIQSFYPDQRSYSSAYSQQQPAPSVYSNQNPSSSTYTQKQPPNQKVSVPKPPEDLLTSPFDNPPPPQQTNIPAPPIPPNPEKDALLSALSETLVQHLHNTIASNASALSPLQAQNSALQKTLQNLHHEHASLISLTSLLSVDESILHNAMRSADTVVADAAHRTVPGVDEVLVAPTVVGEQLYELVAEERACVEARAVLGRALDRGRIGCEGWAKGVRGLAREEFLKKALVRKCARGMGLRVGEEQEWD